MKTITIQSIQALADQLASDLEIVREVLAQSIVGDINPDQAASILRESGIAIF